jgi:hypothetical protein
VRGQVLPSLPPGNPAPLTVTQVFGHDKVAVLEGGLPGWKVAGLEIEASSVPYAELCASDNAARAPPAGGGRYKASLQRDKVSGAWPGFRSGAALARSRRRPWKDALICQPPLVFLPGRAVDDRKPGFPESILGVACLPLHHRQVKSLDEMKGLLSASGGPSSQIADARPPGRFKGADPEPRPGLRSGHMPGSKSVPFPLVGGRGAHRAEGTSAVIQLHRCCRNCDQKAQAQPGHGTGRWVNAHGSICA